MGAAEFIDRFLDAQEWEDNPVEAASRRLIERNLHSPRANSSAVGRAWPQGSPPLPTEERPEDTIRRLALQVGELTEEIMAYQTGRAYQIGFEHGAIAEQRRSDNLRTLLLRVLAAPLHYAGVRFNGHAERTEQYACKRLPLSLLTEIVKEVRR